jgi:hypothetical protein
MYSWGLNRNDLALLNYFFVNQRQPPYLISIDLPGMHGHCMSVLPGQMGMQGPLGPLWPCSRMSSMLCHPPWPRPAELSMHSMSPACVPCISCCSTHGKPASC